MLDDEDISHHLDVITQNLNECLDSLSSSLLTSSILSRDFTELNNDIFRYDNRVNQLNIESINAQEFLAKLEALCLRASFFETQIDVLESHTVSKALQRGHHRKASVNDLKDELLDWRTTETTLDNICQEFNHLKKQYLLSTNQSSPVCSPILNQFVTPVLQQQPTFHPVDRSSISTVATSVFDETSKLRPLKCSSKRKRMSSTTVITGPPIPLKPEIDYLESVSRHKKKRSVSYPSLKDLLDSDYRGDLFANSLAARKTGNLKHFKSQQGLRISSLADSEINYDFRFPTKVITSPVNSITSPSLLIGFPTTQISKAPVLKVHTKSTKQEVKQQTMNWLLQLESEKQSINMPSVTTVSHSTTLHSNNDATTYSKLLASMNENQKQLDQSKAKRRNSIESTFDYLSRPFANLKLASRTAKSIESQSVNSEPSRQLEETQSTKTVLLNATTVSESVYNINEEKKQWGRTLVNLLNGVPNFFEPEAPAEPRSQPQPPVNLTPNDDSELHSELRQALDHDLLFET